MKSNVRSILIPDAVAVSLAVVAGLVVAFLANAGSFFAAFGYRASAEFVNQSTHNALIGFLQRLDSFELTDTIVTFLIWSTVGIFVLALLQTVNSAFSTIRTKLKSNDRYIRPAGFSHNQLVTDLVFDVFYLLLGMALLVAVCIVFFSLILPPANEMVRHLATRHPQPGDFLFAFAGILVTCAGTGVLLYIARLTYKRRYFLPS